MLPNIPEESSSYQPARTLRWSSLSSWKRQKASPLGRHLEGTLPSARGALATAFWRWKGQSEGQLHRTRWMNSRRGNFDRKMKLFVGRRKEALNQERYGAGRRTGLGIHRFYGPQALPEWPSYGRE